MFGWNAGMPAPRTIDELHAAIDQLVADYMGEVQRMVAQRMLDEPRPLRGRRPVQPQPEKRRPVIPAPRTNKRPRNRHKTGRRRSSEEIRQLGFQLVELVLEEPGMGMRHYAAKLGMTSDQMWRPSIFVQQEDLIRSIGEKGAARYFPVYD